MLAFYFDQHVHLAMARGLRTRGVDVLTAYDDGYDRQDDELLLERCVELERILVTYDFGFLAKSSRWQHAGRRFPGIVFGFKDRIDIGSAIRFLEDLAKNAAADTIANSVAYLPAKFPP